MSSKSCPLLLCIFSEYIVGLVTGPLLHETAGHFFSGRLLGFTSLSLTLASAASMGNSRLDTNTRLALGHPCYFQFLYLWSFSLLVLSHPLTVFPGLSCLNSAFVLRNFSLPPHNFKDTYTPCRPTRLNSWRVTATRSLLSSLPTGMIAQTMFYMVWLIDRRANGRTKMTGSALNWPRSWSFSTPTKKQASLSVKVYEMKMVLSALTPSCSGGS